MRMRKLPQIDEKVFGNRRRQFVVLALIPRVVVKRMRKLPETADWRCSETVVRLSSDIIRSIGACARSLVDRHFSVAKCILELEILQPCCKFSPKNGRDSDCTRLSIRRGHVTQIQSLPYTGCCPRCILKPHLGVGRSLNLAWVSASTNFLSSDRFRKNCN